MRVEIIHKGTDIVTGFGSASGPCIEPPEIDYRQSYLDALVIFERGDSWNELGVPAGLVKDALEVEGYSPSSHELEIDDRNWEVLSAVMLVDYPTVYQKDDKGALRFYVTATEHEACGRRRGVYDVVR